ncbi:tetratricopeptide repeat protein [Fontibacter flavus]|uniref:Tetratricopeptide repeat protein n=1 Tax=Fontibacter flavus TaxID=654838 RepID=A0ABV6FQL5_9BACT|nr:tetratricopeptide repeat protein [Cyclobacteriaceae bacterium]
MRVFQWVFASLIGIMFLVSCSGGESNKGDSYYTQGDYENAIVAYDTYLSTKPKDFKALYNRGRAYEELGEYEKAEQDFLLALEQDRKNTQILLSLSNVYQKQKKHNNALLYAEYAVEVPGAPAMAYFMKARALHQIGNTDEAYKEYSTAIKMDKDFGMAYYYRGMLKIATDNKRSGCEDLRAAVKLNYEEAQEALNKYCN